MMNQRLLHYVGMMIVSLSLLGCGVKGDLYYPTTNSAPTTNSVPTTKSTPAANSAPQNNAPATQNESPKTQAPKTAPTSQTNNA